jgi:hypothetical protein
VVIERALDRAVCGVDTNTMSKTASVRRSIEVEYWVIDDSGRLVDPGELVGASPGAEREFVEPMLEIKTTPCETTRELRRELVGRIGAVLERADELGKGLVPLATPLNHGEIRELPSDRTQIQNAVIGPEFAYVRHCAGTHIHFEQQSGHVVDQLNTLIALDPALALVNSARQFRGAEVAAGARSRLYRRLAYAGLDKQGVLWPYATSVDEWNQRLEDRYTEFMTAATKAGVDRQRVESCFDPESAVWTPVQLRAAFGTVEWRSPDTALPSQIIRLAETMATAMDKLQTAEVRIEGGTGRITDDQIVLPEFDAVTDYVDAAITEGLSSSTLRAYLSRMGFEVDAYEPISEEVAGHDPITKPEARQLRREYAQRLRADIRQTRRVEIS